MFVKREVLIVKVNDDLKKVVKKMFEMDYRCVVVVDDENRFVGILIVGDIVRRYLLKNEKFKEVMIEFYY